MIDFYEFFGEDRLYSMLNQVVGPQTKIIGLSTTFFAENKMRILRIFTKLRQDRPDLKFVVGGPNAKPFAKDALEHFKFDVIFTGYGDDSFLPYCKAICSGSPVLHNKWFHSLPLVEADASTSKVNSAGARIDWSAEDHVTPEDVLPLETARGCIFRCKFCSYPGLGKTKRDHVRDVNDIREELVFNYENFGVTHYNILDDTFNDDPDKVFEFYKMSESLPFELKYTAYLRADLVWAKRETAAWLKDSGLVSAFFGIESLDEGASHTIGKGWSGKHAQMAVPNIIHGLWDSQVNVTLGFINGLPGESIWSMWQTHEWCIRNRFNAFYSTLGLSDENSVRRSQFDLQSERWGFRRLPDRKWETDSTSWDAVNLITLKMNTLALNKGRQLDNRQYISALALGLDPEFLEQSRNAVLPAHKERSRDYLNRYFESHHV